MSTGVPSGCDEKTRLALSERILQCAQKCSRCSRAATRRLAARSGLSHTNQILLTRSNVSACPPNLPASYKSTETPGSLLASHEHPRPVTPPPTIATRVLFLDGCMLNTNEKSRRGSTVALCSRPTRAVARSLLSDFTEDASSLRSSPNRAEQKGADRRMPGHAIASGWVSHARTRPFGHAFRYNVARAAIDLDVRPSIDRLEFITVSSTRFCAPLPLLTTTGSENTI